MFNEDVSKIAECLVRLTKMLVKSKECVRIVCFKMADITCKDLGASPVAAPSQIRTVDDAVCCSLLLAIQAMLTPVP